MMETSISLIFIFARLFTMKRMLGSHYIFQLMKVCLLASGPPVSEVIDCIDTVAGFGLFELILLLHPANWYICFHLDWESLLNQRP